MLLFAREQEQDCDNVRTQIQQLKREENEVKAQIKSLRTAIAKLESAMGDEPEAPDTKEIDADH